jgi:hypothetical protein
MPLAVAVDMGGRGCVTLGGFLHYRMRGRVEIKSWMGSYTPNYSNDFWSVFLVNFPSHPHTNRTYVFNRRE